MSLVDLGKKLLESARSGEAEDVRMLMSNGAPFTTDWLGASPLHLAAQSGTLETVAVLIRAGISRDARTKLDRTSLHLAAQEGKADVIELLLKSGADIEAKDMLRMTPLHWAVERNHYESVEILLRHNADVTLKNKFDKSPLEIASDNNSSQIYELLQNFAVLKDNQPLKGDKLDMDEMPGSDSTEIVATSFLDMSKSNKNHLNYIKSSSQRKHSAKINSADINDEVKESVASLKLIQKESDISEVQTSTSVLATLAALAEATAPKSDNTIDGTTWLEENGITMLPIDNSTVVNTALDGGQSLSLTEAGKLALNWSRSKTNRNSGEISHNLSNGNQKVITIVADQSQIPSIIGSSSRNGQILLSSDGTNSITIEREDLTVGKPPKRPKLSKRTIKLNKDMELKDEAGLSEREVLQKELEEARRVAEEYKARFIKKENEAEEYKKKLNEITSFK